jgi:Ca2+-binding RTX toxin-like protein
MEIIRCGSGNDQVFGSTGRNTLEGNGGDDLLFGDAGNDSLDGGDGNDTLDGDRGADIMVGGPDIDTGDYSSRPDTQRLVITLDNQPNDGFNETDNLMSDIEIVLGGAGNDRITAGASPIGVSIQGNEGDDTLNGGNANDSLEGGAGNDSLVGGGGNDTLRGGDGDDRLNALDLNNDTVDGGDGDDEAQTDFVDLVIDVP